MKTTAAPAVAAPPAIWRAFQAQAAWKSWALVALFAIALAEAFAIARLSARPPEFVLVDSDGRTAFVKRAVATEPLLAFLAERARPPDLAVVRFSREFLQLALGIHSATVEANWPAALALMSPALRERVRQEADRARLVEAYRSSQQRTDLAFEDVTIVTRAPGLVHVRAVISRTRRSLVDAGAPALADRVAVDLALSSVTPSSSRPDGVEVQEWAVEQLGSEASQTNAAQGERVQ